MPRILTAYTAEIDDVAVAVDEILSQLDIENNLQKNSVGILTCFSEFIDTGVVQALSERLPFDVIGTTTLSSAAGGEMGELLLSLMVITGDDIEVSTVVTSSLMEEQEAPVAKACAEGMARLAEKPALALCYLSLLRHIGSDEILEMINRATGDVPVFGANSVDHTPDYQTSRVFFNGKAYDDALVLSFISGNIHPKFYVASIPSSRVRRQQAVITASKSNVLKEVNNMTALAYLQFLGLVQDQDQLAGINSIPFVVDYNDGTMPIVRAIFAITPEGYAVCGGSMPENATLSAGIIEYEDVISAAKSLLEAIGQVPEKNGVLLHSCIGRNLALSIDRYDEMETVREAFGEAVPYEFSYVGGEFCPVYDGEGKCVNRFHNDTIIACAL